MNYGKITYFDVANGEGCRTTLFVSGCTHHCEGCFNPETWNFDFGQPFTDAVAERLLASLEPPYVAGMSVLGGEPMEPANQRVLHPLMERMKAEFPGKTLWVYSGYRWEELTDSANKRCHTANTLPLLRCIDVLVDGEFVLAEKDLRLRFRGSRNQRVIDVPATLQAGRVVLYPIHDIPGTGEEAD